MPIKATMTTKGGDDMPLAEVAPKKRKRAVKKFDLSKCGCCGKKLEAFVACEGQHFCSDACVQEYLS